ncbi:autotransporter outer membrane beta-barrel domain-containing protein [Helicobacter mustelae]|uniref:Major ring-forming surface antigen protein, Hsr n=1 Tax=Helicobacter mustelae (strain ATCC 43772 / CCUG 25715 / CIP 103759 / LMG 18044 / NCTC 12198 / R85-136P) TaxID=679897 RepID=D3UHZ7_HELM1|nr:autotransporter outer membrane beta-barrel domain-containing protein [Helicobacter mustelae]CBG40120.1 Major ring-forming surface antigen protein, Hsr [Helicobacter mustelae 12198]SQH71629.1 major ring-forming surface antigen protein Hsr [Helicobacter mustelae]
MTKISDVQEKNFLKRKEKSSSLRNRKFFQPLIATTLAFSLASSFVNAEGITVTVNQAAGANPNAEVSGSGGNATFTFTNGANTTVNGTAVPAANPANPVTGTNIVANIASGVNSFTVNGKADPAGADLGAEGNPVNLNFDFGGIAGNPAKTFTLNLGGAGNANALTGNLNILGAGNATLNTNIASGGPVINVNTGATFNATFSGGATMTGNIVTGNTNGTSGTGTNNITFNGANAAGGAGQADPATVLTGNISTYGGINNVTFEKGTMKGDIIAGNATGQSLGMNVVTFKEQGVHYTGNVIASGTGGVNNTLNFGNVTVSTTNGGNTLIIQNSGITFNNTNGVNNSPALTHATIKPAAGGAGQANPNATVFQGNIKSAYQGVNTLNFYNFAKLEGNPVAGAAAGNTPAANITATNNGANNIVFTDGGLVNANLTSTLDQGINTLVMNTNNIVTNPILLTGNVVTNTPGWAGSNNLLFQNNGTSSPGGAAPASDGTGGSDPAQTVLNQVAYVGNIVANGGSVQAIFSNTYWAPTNLGNLIQVGGLGGGNNANANAKSQQIQGYLDKFNGNSASANATGNLTATNGGTATLVLRNTTTLANLPSQAAQYNVTVGGNNSSANIVLEAPVNASATITYGGYYLGGNGTSNYVWNGSQNTSSVNLIFANADNRGTPTLNGATGSSTLVSDAFGGQFRNDLGAGKVLGVTYQNGIQMSLSDKNVTLQGQNGLYSGSFMAFFKDAILAKIAKVDSDAKFATQGIPLNVSLVKSGNGTSSTGGNSFVNNITLEGVAVGNISALTSKQATGTNGMNNTSGIVNLVLKSDSVLLGTIAGENQKGLTMNMQLNQGAKLILQNSGAGTGGDVALNNLTIASGNNGNGGNNANANITFQGGSVSFDKNQANDYTALQNNTVIDLATGGGSNNVPSRTWFNLLTVGQANQNATTVGNGQQASGLGGNNALFKVYVNADANQGNGAGGGRGNATLNGQNSFNGSGLYGNIYSDRVIVYQTQNNALVTEYLQILGNGNLDGVRYHGGGTERAGNVAVATVKNEGGQASVNFTTVGSVIGFDVFDAKLTAVKTNAFGKVETNNANNAGNSTPAPGLGSIPGLGGTGGTSSGNNASGSQDQANAQDYTTYFISQAVANTSEANQLATATALASNYYLYLANIDSLNKRMGELRSNPRSNGFWMRMFNGMQTTKFALQTTSIYTTVQAGWDHVFGSEGGNDFLGFAVAYAGAAMSSEKKEQLVNGAQKGVKSSGGNAFEISLYNSYVQDGAASSTDFKYGFYSDSVAKFSFLWNKLTMFGEDSSPNMQNFGFTFSQEIGYRFLLGNHNEWYITPQGQVALGYFNQSNIKQTLGSHWLKGEQSSIFTVQGRIGSNFGYRFNQFTEDKGWASELYLGLWYIGDYISGGNLTLVSDLGSVNTLRTLSSTGRFAFNIGTNFVVKDNHRFYFDFERSFGGKIITDYQFNIGYRYNFGENRKYVSLLAGSMKDTIKKDDKKENKEETEEIE